MATHLPRAPTNISALQKTAPSTLQRLKHSSEKRPRPHASGSTLLKEAMDLHLPSDAPAAALPQHASYIRTTNRLRQDSRPIQSTNLQFDWVQNELPSNFVQADVFVGTARHVLMFTPLLLSLLVKSYTWYVDATFKAVQHPFRQLWSIHAFIRQNECTQQVPICLHVYNVDVISTILFKISKKSFSVTIFINFVF